MKRGLDFRESWFYYMYVCCIPLIELGKGTSASSSSGSGDWTLA